VVVTLFIDNQPFTCFFNQFSLNDCGVSGLLAHHRTLAYHRTLWQIFLNSSQFGVIKNVIGAPSQTLQIILAIQSQRSSPKRAVKKIRFFNSKTLFFHFSSF
jgi:hypothetical protein